MNMEQQYAKVSAICATMERYAGTYQAEHFEQLSSGKITAKVFTDKLRTADEVYAQAIADLKAIRFPKSSQRSTHARFISGVQAFRNGIAYAIKAAETGEERYWSAAGVQYDIATKAVAAQLGAVLRDRMKGGR